MKIKRIDLQGVYEDRIYPNKEAMRLELCDFHSIDWTDEDTDIFTLTFEEICSYGEWGYES